MKYFKWLPGRQEETTYFKLCFLQFKIFKIAFDGYILKYPDKTWLLPHKDPIEGRMWRLNIKLKGKANFLCNKEILSVGNFLHFFRPDLYTHSLYVLKQTYKLSLGVAILKN